MSAPSGWGCRAEWGGASAVKEWSIAIAAL
jgi:hypothetical protein